MTALVVGALIAGAISTEWLLYVLARDGRLQRQLIAARTRLQDFRVATGDDARQAEILRAGRATLLASLTLLGCLLVFAAIVGLPAAIFEWDAAKLTLYFVVVSVTAIAWWVLRAAASRKLSK